ncbi:hypothetical protein L7F22_008389 [Adiantum nelumboides]|nr:hypothetical protein [Adiantum nelumboides]
MAPPAQAHLGFEPAEGPFDATNGDGGCDDWVSLILTDVGADTEADNPISLGSLPLSDLDDLDFSNLNGSVSSNGFPGSFERGSPSNSGVLFDPSEMLQPEMLARPSFSHFPTLAEENFNSLSPESGLSRLSPEYLDADTNMPTMDSCSDEDSFYFLVSDICSEETSTSTEAKACNSGNVMNAVSTGDYLEVSGGNRICETYNSLQSAHNPPNSSTVFDKNDMFASKRDTSRKRKHLDRTSRSMTSEGATGDCPQTSSGEVEVKDEEDERRKARLLRNRESAHLSRQRKKIYVDELEDKIKTMASTIAELNNTINLISAENINLRRQMGMFGPPPGQTGTISGLAPWMGAYPPGPMVGNRVMMPGAQVPLVPIPRWKSQQTTSAKKTRKPKAESREKGGTGTAAKKTKKIAGVAAAGLFFFVFLLLPANLQFLGLRPIMQRDSKVWPTTPWHMETSKVMVRAGGRVLTGLNEERNYSLGEEGSGMGSGETALQAGGDSQELKTCDTTDTEGGDHFQRNASIPLAATLFVPRNEQLLRIQGSLIINSVLAGNKAAEHLNKSDQQNVKSPALYNRSLAVDANLKAVALKAAPAEKGALVELQRALAGRLRFDLDGVDTKPVKEDGSLQQWFVEDFTGPIFSSGMCTEVFQFETSPASAPPKPASGSRVQDTNEFVKNKTVWLEENVHRKAGRSGPYTGKSSSYAVPLPPVGHKVMFNGTSSNGTKGGYGADADFTKRKHARSSVVVSVLTGPELGDHSNLTGGRRLPQIFVVVLIDSIKYVTYSCMLPSTAPKAHYEVVVA